MPATRRPRTSSGTIFFESAGLAEIWRNSPEAGNGTRLSFGGQLVVPRAKQENTGSVVATARHARDFRAGRRRRLGNPTDPTLIPNFYVATPIGERGAVGFGVNVPFGLATEFGTTWHGRYDAMKLRCGRSTPA